MMDYLTLKSLHIIFVVCWFSGLFYMVRLFVYFSETTQKPDTEKNILQKQFLKMQRLLWNVITAPAMVLTLITGLWMLHANASLFFQTWMQIKIGLLLGLIAYHSICWRILLQIQKQNLRWNSFQLRMWNEVATIFLIAIVFTAVKKTTTDWLFALTWLLVLMLVLFSAVRIVKSYRQKGQKTKE